MSIICHEKSFVFIHIPKTAGKSLLKEIKKNFHVETIKNTRTIYDNYHSTINDAIENFNVATTYQKITVVRNPWSRVTSWFFFRKNILERGIKEMIKNGSARKLSYTSIDEIRTELTCMNKGLSEWISFYKDRPWDHTWFSLSTTQSKWLGNFKFDDIIKFETINIDTKKIELFRDFNLEKTNSSYNSQIDYRDVYDTESKNLIDKMYQEDIDRFNYTF